MNRADLLHDAFLLAETDLNYSIAMNLTSYLINEDDYQPWVVAMRWFGQLNRLLDRTHILPRFQVIQVLENNNCHSISSSLLYSFYTNSQSYARNLINRIYRQIGWHIHRKDSFKDRLVQNYVVRKIRVILIEICKTTLVIVYINKIMFSILVNPILKF